MEAYVEEAIDQAADWRVVNFCDIDLWIFER
jgi:hypothetical protein